MEAPTTQTLDLVRRLVGFDTTSSGSNMPLIEFVADYLESRGINVQLVPSQDEYKANLIATIGPADAPGIIVSGHTDVVPADSVQWTSPPFAPEVRDGRVYGRGTADMKSFIAVALSLLTPLQGQPLRHPVMLALSFDEELGCRGAPLMMPEFEALAARPLGCIVGEPTLMRVAVAHKGKLATRVHVHGRNAHSAYPETGVNAIDIAAELMVWLRRRALDERTSGMLDQQFEPPYSTVHTGVVRGGSALNIVPALCSFDFEVRGLPGADPQEHLKALESYFDTGLPDDLAAKRAQARLELETMSRYPPLDARHPGFAAWVATLAEDDETPATLSYGSEAGLFAELDIPTVVCGPGSIHQAHQPDEYIELAQLARCERLFSRLADTLRDGLPPAFSPAH